MICHGALGRANLPEHWTSPKSAHDRSEQAFAWAVLSRWRKGNPRAWRARFLAHQVDKEAVMADKPGQDLVVTGREAQQVGTH